MVEFITMAPTSGDGEFVGVPNPNSKPVESWTGTDESAERLPTLDYIKAIAQAAEEGGFSSLLLPTGTGCLDSVTVAAMLTSYTETLKFYLPFVLVSLLLRPLQSNLPRLIIGRMVGRLLIL